MIGLLPCKTVLMAHVQLIVCQDPQDYFYKDSVSSVVISLYQCKGLFWPTLHVPLLNFMRFPSSRFSSPSRLSEQQLSHNSYQLPPLIWYCPQFAGGMLSPIE